MPREAEYIEFKADIVKKTEKAFALLINGGLWWVPQSCAEYRGRGLWRVSKYWAKKEGLPV